MGQARRNRSRSREVQRRRETQRRQETYKRQEEYRRHDEQRRKAHVRRKRKKRRRARFLAGLICWLLLMMAAVAGTYVLLPAMCVKEDVTVEAGEPCPDLEDFLRWRSKTAEKTPARLRLAGYPTSVVRVPQDTWTGCSPQSSRTERGMTFTWQRRRSL